MIWRRWVEARGATVGAACQTDVIQGQAAVIRDEKQFARAPDCATLKR